MRPSRLETDAFISAIYIFLCTYVYHMYKL